MAPATHRAVIVKDSDPKELIIGQKAVPVLGNDEVLIKVKGVTLNPTDYKHVWNYAVLKPGDSLGCDFAGDVVELGKDAEGKGFKVGDPVAGFLRGGAIDSANGAFQGYVKMHPDLIWHVPTDIISYEDAAAMGGIALSTAVQALYHRLNLPPPWAPAREPFPIVIWAGATSVGIYAIRLAKLSGLRVATTASPKNHALMKELGAEVVFDYRDPDAPKKIKEWSEGKIRHGLDNISEHGSAQLSSACFSDEGGTLITLLLGTGELAPGVVADRIYIYSALDPKNKRDYEGIVEWYQKLPQFAKELKVMPLKHWDGGLDAIPEALAYLRAGKTSAQKISLVIDDKTES